MEDTDVPISIGIDILTNGKSLAENKYRKLIDNIDYAIKQLEEYKMGGHKSMDAIATKIVYAPFSEDKALLEAATASIDVNKVLGQDPEEKPKK
jgi:hypothetical protein